MVRAMGSNRRNPGLTRGYFVEVDDPDGRRPMMLLEHEPDRAKARDVYNEALRTHAGHTVTIRHGALVLRRSDTDPSPMA